MNRVGIIIAVLIVLGLAVFIGRSYLSGNTLNLFKTSTATLNNHTFNLYIAKTNKEKEIGLSNRDSLPQDYGMLFPFNYEGNYPFWMKNMRFPLDIIYIDKNKVVEVFTNAQPPKTTNGNITILGPTGNADTVLEINAGLSDKYNIKKGTDVKINL